MKLSRACLITFTLTATALTGCARKPTSKDDPMEGYNRVMFAFNQDIDHLAIRPAAKIYKTLTPLPLRKGVTNFFANLDELTSFPNDILQGRIKYAMLDFWRFAVNSTFGIGGLFDVATRMGMPKHSTTFGLTLAKWRGGKPSPYFVLPIYGPSTIQNTIGLGADTFTQPWIYLNDKDDWIGYSAMALRGINKRARYLDADKLIATSFDPYVFVRDAYMQTQRRAIEKNEGLIEDNSNGDTNGNGENDHANGNEQSTDLAKSNGKA